MNSRLNERSCLISITYSILLFSISYTYGQRCNQTVQAARFNCHPENNPTEDACEQRGCCWQTTSSQLNLSAPNDPGVPPCYYSSDFASYEVNSSVVTDFGLRIFLQKSYPNSTQVSQTILSLTVDLHFETQHRFRIQIYDSVYHRYQVPLNVPKDIKKVNETDYRVDFIKKPFALIVTRNSTNETLFNSSIAPLIFEDQLIKISTQLSSPYLYGLGEHRQPLLINVTDSWQRFTFWTRDFPPVQRTNLYGDHPFHINLEKSINGHRNAHGQFLLNSNAMDIDIQPYPALTYTTIGGIIDLYIFTGPTAHAVAQQYWAVIGKPMLPPFWSLGFHLSRVGYNNITNLRAVIQRMHDADFPYDVQWTDIDAMMTSRDFTYDNETFKDLPKLVRDLQSRGQHYVNVLDAGISSTQPNGTYPPYDEGIARGVFIKKLNSDDPIIGRTAAGNAAFPDFTSDVTNTWWEEMLANFSQIIEFDGVCLSTNEPASTIDGSTEGCPPGYLDNPPFTPHVLGNRLSAKSLCASARQSISQHYNLHSMYGYFQAQATNKALINIRGKRPFVLSRSTFASSGQYAAHWTGDNRASFDHLYYSIPDILSFNMFGITHVGADICGFASDTTEELCTRWMQLGAFYPFMRNNNDVDQADQDPAVFSWQAQQIMKQALLMRYSLIPYWYTLHFEATNRSKMIIRPLFFEFMNDENTYNIDEQFLVGDAILVSPNLEEGSKSVQAYIPNDIWYDFSTGDKLDNTGGYFNLSAPIQKINVHVRGGFIIPMQIPGPTLILGRGNPFQLLVALSPTRQAQGSLYWDDGDSVDSIEAEKYNLFEFAVTDNNTLTIAPRKQNYKDSTMRLDSIKVLGVDNDVSVVTFDGVEYHDFVYNFLDNVLVVHGLDIDMLETMVHTIQWHTSP